MALIETESGWDVEVGGFELLVVQFGGRTSITACADASSSASISLEGAFRLHTRDAVEHRLDGGGRWADLVPLLDLRFDRLRRVSVGRDAHLTVAFLSGARLEVAPDPRHENWELAGPGSLLLVAPPGGGDPRVRS